MRICSGFLKLKLDPFQNQYATSKPDHASPHIPSKKQSEPCLFCMPNATKLPLSLAYMSMRITKIRQVEAGVIQKRPLPTKNKQALLYNMLSMTPTDKLCFCNLVMASIPGTSSQLFCGNASDEYRAPDGQDHRKGVKYLVDSAPNLRTLPSDYVLPLPKCPLAANHSSMPVIDLNSLNGSSEQRMLTVQAIASACAEWGFFRIINHGIKISLMEEMLRAIEEFFDLTWEEKMKYASDDVMNPVRYGTSLNTSLKHALHWRDYLRHFGHPFHNSFHLWPNNPPNYKFVARKYLEEVWHLALKLAGAISEGLGLESDYIERSLGEGTQIAASNYYPPCPEPHRTLGLSAHSDHGGLTILMQNDVNGLQVKHEEEWVVVQNVPGSFVVNIGDYLEILSNGRYKSVEHRAVVNEHRARISVAVGHGPELTATVAPASPLVDRKTDIQYRPITYRDYVQCQQSSAVRGKTPLQAIMIKSTSEKASAAPDSHA